MKLKYITETAYKNEYEEKLKDVLNNNNFSQSVRLLLNKKCLIRFSKNDDDIYIRKSEERTSLRKPKSTSYFADDYIEEYRKKYFPNIASRQKSVFCFPIKLNLGTIKYNATMFTSTYGNEIYIILINNTAKIFQSTLEEYSDFFGSVLRRALERYSEFDENSNYAKELKQEIDKELSKYFSNAITDLNKINYTTVYLGNEVFVEYKMYAAINIKYLEKYSKNEELPEYLMRVAQ